MSEEIFNVIKYCIFQIENFIITNTNNEIISQQCNRRLWLFLGSQIQITDRKKIYTAKSPNKNMPVIFNPGNDSKYDVTSES